MNILPNKQVLWWAFPYCNNRITYRLLLTVDTVLSYKNDSFDNGYNNLSNKAGAPPTADNFTVICSVSNPYVRIYNAWKEACLRKYKVLPTLKQWFNVNSGIRVMAPTVSEHDLSTTTGSLLDTASLLFNKTPSHYINADNIKQDIKNIPSIQAALLTDSTIDGIIETITVNEKNTFLNSLSTGKIVNTNNIDLFKNWKTHYDEELAASVYSLLEADFTRFNYNKDSWK